MSSVKTCTKCRGENDSKYKLCEKCRAYLQRHYLKAKAEGKCHSCHKVKLKPGEGVHCPKCRTRQSSRQKKRYRDLDAAGLCTGCGKRKQRSGKLCRPCRKAHKECKDRTNPPPGCWQVYKMTFEDGCEYVGMTKQNMHLRELHHRAKKWFANWEINRRMLEDMPYKIAVLSRHETKEQAAAEELRQINKLTKSLNWTGVQEREPTYNPPIPGHEMFTRRRTPRKRRNVTEKRPFARCSFCYEVKSSDGFCSDPSRFNGMDSRCKACRNALRRHYYRILKEDPDSRPIAYKLAKEAVQLDLVIERKKKAAAA